MHLFKFYQYINILSLDVVAGAVIGSLFFARIFEVSVSLDALAALALTVWIVYTLDHLRDAMFIHKVASTDRHRFHQRYFRPITMILAFVIIMDFVLIWFVPQRVLLFGLGLWFIVAIYLVLQRYLKFMKEFFVACLYTAGILLPSVAIVQSDWLTLHYILAGKYFITAWMNLLLFSLVDHNEDRRHEQHSFVTWFGPSSARYGILFLAFLNISSGIWLWSFDHRIAVIFISMNVLLLAILFFQKYLAQNNYYRIAGDAVFFIPVFDLL
jgi:4-hydroxybenzoate polyprenyltransferase